MATGSRVEVDQQTQESDVLVRSPEESNISTEYVLAIMMYFSLIYMIYQNCQLL